ncbi:MAG: alkaline phosphatase family protein [Bradyrhizobium sp.]
MRNRKLKTTLLSTAALIAVAAVATSNRPVAAQGFLAELTPVFNLVDQLIGDIQTPSQVNALKTQTPIKHLVVIFNENRSFDHYFGTYPKALNPGDGEPTFTAAKNTPIPNNYVSPANASLNLLTENPNFLNTAGNGANAANPFRIDRTQANTADQSHAYTNEQEAFDLGKLDLFPADVGNGSVGGPTGVGIAAGLGAAAFNTAGQTMGYFDGNTVTAFWNYAQNFAMSDNSWSDTFGPSTPGALEVFSGQTNGIIPQTISKNKTTGVFSTTSVAVSGAVLADGTGAANGFTEIGDEDPTLDVCSPAVQPGGTGTTTLSTAKNIGDLLNAANIPWGSFVGGFNLQAVNANMSTGCKGVTQSANGAITFASNAGRSSMSPITGETVNDYTQHHIWFQYFKSTANPNHIRPASNAEIGHNGPANHAYDIADFTTAVKAGNFPAVSFIKQAAFQDGHPGNSNPLDEQTGVVDLINFLQAQPDWSSTAVIIAYDDSDGWYDHAFTPPTTRVSFTSSDALSGPDACGVLGTSLPTGVNNVGVQGRCGPGMRQPFLVISPYAKKNYVSHVFITQASIPQFIEDNWLKGERLGGGSFDASTGSIMDMFNFDQIVADGAARTVMLDPTMGTVTSSKSGLPF